MSATVPGHLRAQDAPAEQEASPVGQGVGEGVRYDDLPIGVAEFTTLGSPWDHTNLTYFFRNGTGDIAGTAEQRAFRDAFALWAGVTTLTFAEVFSADPADIIVEFAFGEHGDGFPFDGPYGLLAHAFSPAAGIGGDAHFDEGETWTMATRSDSNQPMDLVTIAAHEIGHSLGLGHSDDPDALMFPTYFTSHRFLGRDDVNGIQSLYPASQTLTVGLSASSSSVAANTPVTLTAVSNTDVGPTPHFITILEGNTVLAFCSAGTVCTHTVNSPAATTRSFQARISASDGTNVQAQSPLLPVTWGPAPSAVVTLAASATRVKKGTPVTLTATANTDVGSTPQFIAIIEGTRVRKACDAGTTCSVAVTAQRVKTRSFVARISAADGSNAQAQSNTVTVSWVRRL